MPDFMYVATSAGVDANNTWRLLRDWNAIWCPPSTYEPWRVRQHPTPNDRVWLVWISAVGSLERPFLLGGGRLLAAPQPRFGSDILWTNAFAPGIRAAAEQFGYRGPTNMSFVRLDQSSPEAKSTEITWPEHHEIQIHNLTPRNSGLHDLTPEEAQLLSQTWPIL